MHLDFYSQLNRHHYVHFRPKNYKYNYYYDKYEQATL